MASREETKAQIKLAARLGEKYGIIETRPAADNELEFSVSPAFLMYMTGRKIRLNKYRPDLYIQDVSKDISAFAPEMEVREVWLVAILIQTMVWDEKFL